MKCANRKQLEECFIVDSVHRASLSSFHTSEKVLCAALALNLNRKGLGSPIRPLSRRMRRRINQDETTTNITFSTQLLEK